MRLACLLLLCLACEKESPVGADSPEAPLRELLLSFERRDASAMRHAFASPDRLRKALTCPADSTFISDLQGAIDGADRAASFVKGVDAKMQLRSMRETGRTVIAKGDSFRGCTATEPFEVRNFSMKLQMDAFDRVEEIDDTGDVIQLDGRWYALLKN